MVVLALALLLGACGGGEQASPAGPRQTSSPVGGITPTPGPSATLESVEGRPSASSLTATTPTTEVPREEWRSGVTRDGISIALAKLEREGEEVRVWIAFRKVNNPPPGEEIVGFDVNIRDDRGNTYPQDRMGTYAVPLWSGVDIRLLPMGFTWVTSATIGMPAQAPIQSIIVNVNKNAPGYSNWHFPYS
jgi:hypothetical protein